MFIKKLIPQDYKEYLKNYIKLKLNLVPKRQLNITNKVIEIGIDKFLNFKFLPFKSGILNYVNDVKLDNFNYKYAKSVEKPVLYNTIYVLMLKGLLGELKTFTDKEKDDWANFLNKHQNENDGFFYDVNLDGYEFNENGNWGDGWGRMHLMGHIIIAFARINRKPKFKLSFLDFYFNPNNLKNWLNSFDFSNNVWSQSNYIMNLVTVLQYSRDYLNDINSQKTIDIIFQWLLKNQNIETGLWHNYEINDYDKLADAIRGSYHFFPLFEYDNIEILYHDKIIDNLLRSQNNWGGFEKENHPSGACEDIDVIDPLIRFSMKSDYRKDEVVNSINKAFIWVLSNQEKDNGFVYMLETPQEYGGHNLTSSKINESNLFATWFRTLSIAYIVEYLNIENDFNTGKYPGYEIKLK